MNIRPYRVETGLSLRRFARLLGWGADRLCRYEKNQRTPGVQELKAIQKLLAEHKVKVTLEQLAK